MQTCLSKDYNFCEKSLNKEIYEKVDINNNLNSSKNYK